jgi:hypothetical protein
MSPEMIGIVILGIMGVIQLGGLVYLNRSFQEQLRRNIALETQFQCSRVDNAHPTQASSAECRCSRVGNAHPTQASSPEC